MAKKSSSTDVKVGKLNDQSRKALDDLLSETEDNINDALNDSINKFIKRVKNNVNKFDFVASGNLYQSIKALPTKKRDGLLTARVEIADYWEDLEKGTNPKGFTKENFKNLQPRILQWIRDKESLSAIATTDWRRRAFSYLITRSILRKGTIKRFGYKGKPFLSMELPQLEKDFEVEFSKPEE